MENTTHWMGSGATFPCERETAHVYFEDSLNLMLFKSTNCKERILVLIVIILRKQLVGLTLCKKVTNLKFSVMAVRWYPLLVLSQQAPECAQAAQVL